ncbi:hypothetical protein ACFE04_021393 [Oxalis oulophora]
MAWTRDVERTRDQGNNYQSHDFDGSKIIVPHDVETDEVRTTRSVTNQAEIKGRRNQGCRAGGNRGTSLAHYLTEQERIDVYNESSMQPFPTPRLVVEADHRGERCGRTQSPGDHKVERQQSSKNNKALGYSSVLLPFDLVVFPGSGKAVTDGFCEPRRFQNDQTATKPNCRRKKSGKESQVRDVQPPVTSVRDILVLKSYRHRLRHATRLRHRPQPAPWVRHPTGFVTPIRFHLVNPYSIPSSLIPSLSRYPHASTFVSGSPKSRCWSQTAQMVFPLVVTVESRLKAALDRLRKGNQNRTEQSGEKSREKGDGI